MIKLWGRANSSNVMKLIWLLQELGLPYDRVDVGGPFAGTATPEYRAMNPLGLVPSLEEDGLALFESNAILRYLCNAHAGERFYPAAPAARAVVDMWLDFQQTALTRPHGILFQGLIRTLPAARDHAAIARAATESAAIWAILDARLSHQPWVCGGEISIADMAWGIHVHRWFVMEFEGRPDAPALRGWYERLLQRPAYRDHCSAPLT